MAGLVALVLTVLIGRAAWNERSVRRLVADSRAAMAQGRWPAAIRSAAEALKRSPNDPRASLALAVALTRAGRPLQAEPYYRQAAALAPDVQRRRAEALLEAGRNDLAAEVYAEILRRDPADAEALRRLASLRLAEQRWDEALDLAGRLISRPDTELVGQAIAAMAHHDMATRKLASPAAAIAGFQRILELDPELREVPIRPARQFWDYLARDLLAEGRTAEARESLERGMRQEEDAGLVELLARTYWDEGRIREAERLWQWARELDPRSSDPLIGLGRVALARKQYDEAAQYFREAAARAPGSIVPLENLARALVLNGSKDEARSVRQRLESLRRSRETADQSPPAAGPPPDRSTPN
jgi:tetratricopeptide (TPR) repeat protein